MAEATPVSVAVPDPKTPADPLGDANAWTDTIETLLLTDGVTAVGRAWRHRAAEHLAHRLNAYLRDGLPMGLPANEQAALSLLRGVGTQLLAAGRALDDAAQALRAAQRIMPANRAHHAAQAAKRAAADILGDAA